MGRKISLREDFNGPALRRLAKASRDSGQSRRLLVLAEIYDGGRRTDAARIGSVGLQVIRDWVLRFNVAGADGLIDKKPPGARTVLDEAQRRALVEIVESGPIPAVHGVVRWRLLDLVQWMGEEFGVSVSRQTLGRELNSLGYAKLSARPRHHAQDREAMSAFKKTFRPEWRKSATAFHPERPWRFGGKMKPESARRTKSPGVGRSEEHAPRHPRINARVRPISSGPSVQSGASARRWCCPNATPKP